MNARSGKTTMNKMQHKKGAQGSGGSNQKKANGKMQARGVDTVTNGTFPGDALSKYCWQSHDLEYLNRSADPMKRKDGLP